MCILISVFRRIELCVSVKILVLYHIAVIFYWKIDVLLGIITKSGRFIIFSVTLKKTFLITVVRTQNWKTGTVKPVLRGHRWEKEKEALLIRQVIS